MLDEEGDEADEGVERVEAFRTHDRRRVVVLF